MTKLLLTIDEVAEQLGVCARTVRTLPIRIVRVGRLRRYDPRDVMKFIEGAKVESRDRY